jgi:hypothetical protein
MLVGRVRDLKPAGMPLQTTQEEHPPQPKLAVIRARHLPLTVQVVQLALQTPEQIAVARVHACRRIWLELTRSSSLVSRTTSAVSLTDSAASRAASAACRWVSAFSRSTSASTRAASDFTFNCSNRRNSLRKATICF